MLFFLGSIDRSIVMKKLYILLTPAKKSSMNISAKRYKPIARHIWLCVGLHSPMYVCMSYMYVSLLRPIIYLFVHVNVYMQ